MELFSLLAKLTLDTDEFSKGIDQAEKDLDSIDVDDPKLGIDNDEFNKGVEESQSLGDGFSTAMETAFKNIKTALTTTGIVAGITKIVDGLKEAINMTAETADGIEKGASKLGISQKAYQEWDHALRQSGTSIDVVKKGIMQFQAAIKAADPATPFADAEDQVDGLADKTAGLSTDAYEALRDLGMLGDLEAGKFGNAEELMNAALLKLAEFDGSTDERGILVRKLFGRGGDELNPLLDEGVEGVKALLTEASDLGLIMSDEEIKNAVAYGDAVENLESELKAIQQAFLADVIPVLRDAVQWLTDFMTQLNPRLQTSSIYSTFEQINKKTLAASNQIDEATVEAADLIEKLQTMGNYWTLDDEGKMTWDALASRALELFPQLSDYIDKDGHKISGNTQEILRNVKAWALLEKQRLLSNAMAEKEAAVADQLTTAYEKGAEARQKESEAKGKKTTALEAMEDFLNSKAGEGYKWNLEQNYGYDGNMTEEFYNEHGGGILNWVLGSGSVEQKNAVTAWQETEKEAQNLREEAEKLKEEANNAKSELADQQKYLMEEMGYTQEEIETTISKLEKLQTQLNNLPTKKRIILEMYEEKANSHAIGSAYIPYDNYPALLHRGEKVLTATEARQESNNVDLSSLGDSITAAIKNGMNGVTVNSYLNGRSITAEVNRNNTNDLKSRRYRA